MPGLLPAVAGAGVSSLVSGLFTGSQNRRSQRWSERMYDKQFQDNLRFWMMQNEYNSPQAQMQRLQEAGLNPNLVYGGSSGGTAGSAEKISTPEVQAAQFRTPQLGSLDVLGKYFDYEIKQAQADNLRAQNTAILEKAALDAATRELTGVKTSKEVRTLDYAVEAAQEQVRKMKADTAFTLAENERKAAMNSSNLNEAAERILTMRLGRSNTRKLMKGTDLSNELKQLDIDLREQGIFPNDPMWARILGRFLSGLESKFSNRRSKPGGSGW